MFLILVLPLVKPRTIARWVMGLYRKATSDKTRPVMIVLLEAIYLTERTFWKRLMCRAVLEVKGGLPIWLKEVRPHHLHLPAMKCPG